MIVGFSVVPGEGARLLAEKVDVHIRRYDIIYQMTDEVRAALEGMLKPERQEKNLGRAWCSKRSTSAAWERWPAAGCWPASIRRDARVR